ncbi:MAG TPA: NAD(P)-binding domain-containing protein [Polyangiaceae bacterium]
MKQVTVLGLGAMGSSLANALLRTGHEVTVWNRSPERANALAARGARKAESVSQALADSPLCIVCVLDYAAAREILEQAPRELAGKDLINLTNGTPAQALELAARTVSLGARYLDGAILVTPESIGETGAVVLYSGNGDASSLAAFGDALYLGPDASLAAVQDLAFLSSMFGMFAGYLHAAALLRSKGLSVADVTPGIVALLEAMIRLLPETATQIDTGVHPTPTSNNRMMTAALTNIVAGSEHQGVAPDLIRPILALFERAVASGSGDRDIAALVPLLAATAS